VPTVDRQSSSHFSLSTSVGTHEKTIPHRDAPSSGRDLSHKSMIFAQIIENVACTGIAKIVNPESFKSNFINIPLIPCHLNTVRQENQETTRSKRNRESPTNSSNADRRHHYIHSESKSHRRDTYRSIRRYIDQRMRDTLRPLLIKVEKHHEDQMRAFTRRLRLIVIYFQKFGI